MSATPARKATHPAANSSRIPVHIIAFRYNYFDPDNYISTYALLQTGYSYLHEQVKGLLFTSRKLPASETLSNHCLRYYASQRHSPILFNTAPRQVRLVLERSGAFINAKGQLPHHFVGDKPVFQALSGATQTGPNVFWIMSCFNYVKHSGNMTWLQA